MMIERNMLSLLMNIIRNNTTVEYKILMRQLTRTDHKEMIYVLISCFTEYKWRRYFCCILILCFVAYMTASQVCDSLRNGLYQDIQDADLLVQLLMDCTSQEINYGIRIKQKQYMEMESLSRLKALIG
jgi:hypothetical protein